MLKIHRDRVGRFQLESSVADPVGKAQCRSVGLDSTTTMRRVKIVDTRSLPIPELKVVRFARFHDARGYFTEPYRRSDVSNDPSLDFLHELAFPQANESFSRAGVIRGLHFQWNPYMGKLVRTVCGRMVDLALDIRLESPTFGKIVAYDMPASSDREWSEWIWVPPGFAHGNYFTEETIIEYLCTGEYSPGCEAAVSPLAPDLDWSLCDTVLRDEFQALIEGTPTVSDKDRNAGSLLDWQRDPRADNFRYHDLTEQAT
jgi:dTDP-4-dehydrorhamnose 3,5-epimerase